jgi:outer membrane protein TolC
MLTSCAGLAPDGGAAVVAHRIGQLTGTAPAVRPPDDTAPSKRVAELLASPLSIDAAAEIAVLNHPELQAALAQLAFSDAERVAASRLPNPVFAWKRSGAGDDREWERGLHFNLVRLIAMPWSGDIAARQLAMKQGEVVAIALSTANEARRAWIDAVAAEEAFNYAKQVREVADAGAELAQRMAAVGNWSRLAQAREQSFYSDAAIGVARAERERMRTREALTRALGLWGALREFRLPPRLPDLPERIADQPDIEQRAMDTRLDIEAGRAEIDALKRNLGLTRSTRLVNVFELGVERKTKAGHEREHAIELSIELPIFDLGSVAVAKSEALVNAALHRLAATAVEARSNVRESYLNQRHAYDMARHFRDEVVPLRKRIAEESLLRYNGMLRGVFDLLADTRSQIAGVNGYLDALRDFWQADNDLRAAMLGRADPVTLNAATPMRAATESKGH